MRRSSVHTFAVRGSDESSAVRLTVVNQLPSLRDNMVYNSELIQIHFVKARLRRKKEVRETVGHLK